MAQIASRCDRPTRSLISIGPREDEASPKPILVEKARRASQAIDLLEGR